jgi:hypothetical protein
LLTWGFSVSSRLLALGSTAGQLFVPTMGL